MSVKQIVDSAISCERVMVFSKSSCPHSRRAKQILANEVPSFGVMELDQRPDGDAIQDYLQQLTGARTVPRIFLAGEFVGGEDEVVELERSGALHTMLREKGVLA